MENSKPIRIIIADDHKLFVDGIRSLLSFEENLEVIKEAYDGEELLHLVHEVTPDIILMDINMPRLNGLEATRIIRKKFPGIKVIVISMYSDEDIVEKIKAAGARGYILKNVDKEKLVLTIERVMQGETCFTFNRSYHQPDYDSVGDDFVKKLHLTQRELEIIRLIKEGNTSQQIADNLHISLLTVDTHRKNIIHKLGVRSVAALMRFAIEHGI